jgi:DNA-binding LacI/PurR family transcriptional regulator
MKSLMTASELAQHLELSRTTVSLVLNGRAPQCGIPPATAQRVLDAAKKWKYQPNPIARQLAGKRSNAIGILINAGCPTDPRLLRQMEVLAARRHVRFLIGHAAADKQQIQVYLEDFRARGVDAVLTLQHDHPSCRDFIYDELTQLERVLYFYKPNASVPDPWYVEPDFFEVGRVATQHLIDRGRRRIGIVGFSETIFPSMRPRRLGYEQALREGGFAPDVEMEWLLSDFQSPRWTEPLPEAEASAIVEKLVVHQKADAIVATTDLDAIRIIDCLKKRGYRVPDDVAIVGTDNLGFATLLEPHITNVDLKTKDLAEAVVSLLFEMLDADPADQVGRAIVVQPELIIRESS